MYHPSNVPSLHVNNGSNDNNGVEGAVQEAVKEGTSGLDEAASLLQTLVCTLGIHDEAFSRAEVLINGACFPQWHVATGSRMKIIATNAEFPPRVFRSHSNGQHQGIFGRRMSCKAQHPFN